MNDSPTTPAVDAENEVSEKKLSFAQRCRRALGRGEKKWIVTHECIEENLDWAEEMFHRQEIINKNCLLDLSKITKESYANKRELDVQMKMNEENMKRLDALEKLLSVKESSAGNRLTEVVKTVVVPVESDDREAKNCYPIKLNRVHSSVASPKHHHIPTAPKSGEAIGRMSMQDQPRP